MTDMLEDISAEQAAVGAVLWSAEALAEVTAVLGPSDWSQPKHALIVAAATAVVERGEPVDPVTLLAELERRDELLKIGGAPYLHTLQSLSHTAASAGYYAEIVAEKALLRRVGQVGTRLSQLANLGLTGTDPDEVLDRARAELDTLARGRRRQNAPDFDTLLETTVAAYEVPVATGLATPWPELDDLLGGLRPGTLTIIGGRPGAGKSVLGVNIAIHAAAGRHRTLLASLEMPRSEVMDRLIANAASVNLERLMKHRLTDWDWVQVERAAHSLKDLPLRIEDDASLSVAGIRSLARDSTRADGLHLVVVDYLQLVKPAEAKAPREQQVAAISRSLKLLARDLEVPVVALAQVNRGPTQRANTRPAMSDLRESGAIESDADIVMLIHHDEDTKKRGEIEIEVGKNRNGRCGLVSLGWSPQYARARSIHYPVGGPT